MAATYPENFEQKVGFDRIRELLRAKCLSNLGEEWVEQMCFQTSFEAISQQLGETNEFCKIIREFPGFPVSYFFDVRSALHRIRLEGRFLEIEELFDLKRSLDTLRAIVAFFDPRKSEILPLLVEKSKKIQVYPYVNERIDTILTKNGKIKDNATPELFRIRKDIVQLQSGVTRKLQTILKQAIHEGWAEADAAVVIRDGRAVIPVASANKRKLKGIVYDESATGKTSYIEPNEIVEMNNEIRELENAERREVVRILTVFSNDIRPYIDDLLFAYDFLGEIDFIRAKALLASEFNAIYPDCYPHSHIDWKKAVHPLLMLSLRREKREIVPLDIYLNSENTILLISGPNAGGKSVCLKTVGLLQYMLQCGMLVPVEEGSKTGIFQQIFIDIGDEQSIENDLSTYSSHLLNMKYFVRNSNGHTLTLIDEFGTGTEPMLGGAIAEAILDKLNKLHAFGVITTHYTNLKHFASLSQGIINGAMLYDNQQMRPLFKLEIGKPGSSFAFEIARKIGLPEEILQDASERIGKKHVDFDKSLRKVTRDKHYWETKRERIRRLEKSIDEMAGQYQKELLEIRQLRKEILTKAKEEATLLMAKVNRQIENAIREIKESKADKEHTREIRKGLEELKGELLSADQGDDAGISMRLEKTEKREKRRDGLRIEKNGQKPVATDDAPNQQKPTGLAIGDKVLVQGQAGELVGINAKTAIVALGQLLVNIPVERVEKISHTAAKKLQSTRKPYSGAFSGNYSERRLSFKPEIDIRGQRAEEAIANIRTFIDEAIMFEVGTLRILHGKGHGILKETIRNYLKSEPVVSTFRDEHVQFGGAGITIVELDT